jgi:S-adenosylmethionine:diacylglycerol 3-amino-3-carboxypropyl transferase
VIEVEMKLECMGESVLIVTMRSTGTYIILFLSYSAITCIKTQTHHEALLDALKTKRALHLKADVVYWA